MAYKVFLQAAKGFSSMMCIRIEVFVFHKHAFILGVCTIVDTWQFGRFRDKIISGCDEVSQ